MESSTLFQLSASDAADRLAAGEISSLDLIHSCLQRIDVLDEDIQAWAAIDRDFAIEQARAADLRRQSGQPLGALHGLPVAVKDIIDVDGMACENGTPIDAGRCPEHDAHLVSRLKSAGAVILGKTVTTELAFYHPSKTRNPHDLERTPGGSSSGSAAAVAACMVPFSIGSQTNGSMIRPASFCGVVGYKPTFGAISRNGVLRLAPSLDTIGVFGRTIEDCALLADALIGHDASDKATKPMASLDLLRVCQSEPPVEPAIAFVKSPVWERAEPSTHEGFAELLAALGETCDEVALPDIFEQAMAWHRELMTAEMARHLRAYERRGPEMLSDVMTATLEQGRQVGAVAYQEALDGRDVLNGGLDALLERFDAIVTPAAVGEAPLGLASTGDPSFATLWTYCGAPALSLPLLEGPNGLPVGVQLVGRKGDDGRLLRSARWLMSKIGGGP